MDDERKKLVRASYPAWDGWDWDTVMDRCLGSEPRKRVPLDLSNREQAEVRRFAHTFELSQQKAMRIMICYAFDKLVREVVKEAWGGQTEG